MRQLRQKYLLESTSLAQNLSSGFVQKKSNIHFARVPAQSGFSIKTITLFQVKRSRSPSPPPPRPPNINAANSAYFRPSPHSHARIPAVSSVYGHPSAVASGQPTYALSTTSGGVYPFPVSSAQSETQKLTLKG